MSKIVWYKYLVEVGFINNQLVSCNQCKVKISIQEFKSKIDEVRWIYKNPIDIGSLLCTGKCTGIRSLRFTS